MAVLEKLLKTKLPSGEELSKKLLKGKLFTKRGAKPAETLEAAACAGPLPDQAAPEPAPKPKKPSLADKAQLAKALLKAKKKGPESYGGPSSDRIARALRRDQLEPQFDFAPPPRIFASPPEAAAILPRPVQAPVAGPAEVTAPAPALTLTDNPEPAPAAATLTEAEVTAALQAVTAPVFEEAPAVLAAKPAIDPRAAAILAFAGEAELEIAALAAALEHRTGLKFEITENAQNLHLHVEELTVLISQHPRALSEAELLNLLYPDEEEWAAIGQRFGAMSRHISVSATGTAETLADLRHRTTVIAGVVVALLDLMPSCLGTIWPLGASLISEADFRELAMALAEPAEAEVEIEEPVAQTQAAAELEETTSPVVTAEPEAAHNPQAEEPPAPRA